MIPSGTEVRAAMPRRAWRRSRGHVAGNIFGILIFVAGVLLLIYTFKLAVDLFGRDPATLLGMQKGKPLDLNNAGAQLAGVVVKVLLLLVMAIVSGMIANRGIRLYADSKPARPGEPKESK